ncbi:PREDICTED: rRNA methyltransferase 2, mitochondrial [Polistes canadensis]|uniref:rRNA methyltransferase 2, mitochondrial n=1 Tax=Polistes canadensis TaxID=91411 RepID=UPI000718E47D|nr:PREDICTED: rRNA methyltransferase 2, mitochondrial [Polistes canadensis]
MRFLNNILTTRCVHTCTPLLREKPTNLKGKKHSSQLWLERQLRDPYVEKAKQENYRCRSAFKLIEINERKKIFNFGDTVIDCGASPGSWTQVAVNLTNANGKKDGPVGKVIGIDKLPIFPVEGATVIGQMDFTMAEAHKKLHELLNQTKANVVLSDMAPNATGVRELDHDNIMKLAYCALKFALQVLCKDGVFVTKVWDGSKTIQLCNDLSKFYTSIKIFRPIATRNDSTETYLIAKGFKGLKVSSPVV